MPVDAGPRSRETAWLLAAGALLLLIAVGSSVEPLAQAADLRQEGGGEFVVVGSDAKRIEDVTIADHVYWFGSYANSAFLAIYCVLACALVVVARPVLRRHVRAARMVLVTAETYLLLVAPSEAFAALKAEILMVPGESRAWRILSEISWSVLGVVVALVAVALAIAAMRIVGPTPAKVVHVAAPPPPPVSPFADLDDADLPSYIG